MLCAWAALVGAACVQGYPAKPIRVVVSIAAGGTGDMLGRFVADRLTDAFKQQVVVENRAGANGIIGVETVVNSPPDGYTLFLHPQATSRSIRAPTAPNSLSIPNAISRPWR